MDEITGEIQGEGVANVAIGKNNQISVYAETATWREFVRRDIAELHDDANELKRWCRGLMIAIVILYALGTITTAVAVWQFDRANNLIDTNVRRLEQIEQRLFMRDSGVPFP